MARFSTSAARLEAFSDGVLAVIITIMVLELRAPARPDLSALAAVLPSFAIYAFSFVFIGIYWNNHHHLLRAAGRIDGRVMWANLHLLFWLSLVPFATAWLGRNATATVPTAFYTAILLLDAIAYSLLQQALLRVHGRGTAFAKAVALDVKGLASIVVYAGALAAAFRWTIVTDVLLVAVALMWLVPDRRFEPLLRERGTG